MPAIAIMKADVPMTPTTMIPLFGPALFDFVFPTAAADDEEEAADDAEVVSELSVAVACV